jgi:hypothetical protein
MTDVSHGTRILNVQYRRGICILVLSCGHDVSLLIEPGATWPFNCPECLEAFMRDETSI